jgi:hypothetical protein
MVDTTKETKPEAAPETKVEDTKDAKKDEKKVVEEKPHGSADNITKYKVRVRTQFFLVQIAYAPVGGSGHRELRHEEAH